MIGEWISSFFQGGFAGLAMAIIMYHVCMEYLKWRNDNNRGDKK